MTKLRDGLTYPPIKVGFILLFIALVMSLGASYNVPREKTWTGTWKPGNYTLGGEMEDFIDVVNRTLEMSSDNALVRIIADGNGASYTLTGNSKLLTLDSTSRVLIFVESGEVTYSYTVKWVDYPYAYLSFPALFIMIVGNVLAIRGYFSFLESLKENKLQQKRRKEK